MNCWEAIDLMGDVLDDRLAPEFRAGFHEHMDDCPSCCTYLDQLRTTVTALGHMPRTQADRARTAELIAAFRREHTRRR